MKSIFDELIDYIEEHDSSASDNIGYWRILGLSKDLDKIYVDRTFQRQKDYICASNPQIIADAINCVGRDKVVKYLKEHFNE